MNTDSSLDLFFKQFEVHLKKILEEGELASAAQRANLLLAQLKHFRIAIQESLGEKGDALQVDLNGFINLFKSSEFFEWLIKSGGGIELLAVMHLKRDHKWITLLGQMSLPNLNNIEWIEEGLWGRASSNQPIYVLCCFGQPRFVLKTQFLLEDSSTARQTLRFWCKAAEFFVEPLTSVTTAGAHNLSLIVSDPKIFQTISLLNKAAKTDVSILLEGESGTGKEVMANYVHQNSQRQNKPMVAVNCAAIPSGLMESELFGHEKGSFTGAVSRQIGKVELANGGTLFLDEIGEMELQLQAKLLRFLQLREFHRVGGRQKIQVDVRIIAASNRDLRAQVDAGAFREDLYYRLGVMPVLVPPLRERPLDIVPLLYHFVGKYAKKFGFKTPSFSPAALRLLCHYQYPGNVRELENMVQNMLVLSQGDDIDLHHFPAHLAAEVGGEGLQVNGVKRWKMKQYIKGRPAAQSPTYKVPKTNEELKNTKKMIQNHADHCALVMEKKFVNELLQRSKGSVPKAAELAGMNRTMLYKIVDRTKDVSVSD